MAAIITEQDKKTLAQCYAELNSIRARDGRANGMSEESWDKLTDRMAAIVLKVTGKMAHCNPYLYKRYEELQGD